jgi:hypothetical protein
MMAARLDQKDKVVALLTLGKGLELKLTGMRGKDLEQKLTGMRGKGLEQKPTGMKDKNLEQKLTGMRDKDLDNWLVGMTGCLKGKQSEQLVADMRCVLRDKYSHEEDLHCGEGTDQQMVADMNWSEAVLDDQYLRPDIRSEQLEVEREGLMDTMERLRALLVRFQSVQEKFQLQNCPEPKV